jgi:hypothetical protein
MIDMLKKMAIQKLVTKMGANSLSAEATSEAASEGAGALMEKIQAAVSGGNLDQVKDLFSSAGASTEENGIFQEAQSKMASILQNKGMNAEEAQAEAGSAMPDLINSLKSKFESQDEADSAFDIGAIASLLGGGGGLGGMLGKVKDLL